MPTRWLNPERDMGWQCAGGYRGDRVTAVNTVQAGSAEVQELFSLIRAPVMEVPCFLPNEHHENHRCTEAIKGACLVRLTKQVPSGHRSLCIASQKHAGADNEAQGWEAPNCLISMEYFFSYNQGTPLDGKMHETITAPTRGQDRGRGGVGACSPDANLQNLSALPSPASTSGWEPVKNTAVKRKRVFKNKGDSLWAPQVLPSSPCPQKHQCSQAELTWRKKK